MSCEQDKERSLKDYWYPKEIGEQNEILPSLKANVNRGSPLTKGIDFTVTTILYSIPLIILYISYKTWYSFLDVSNGIFVENNKCVLIVGFVIVLGLIAGGVYYWATRRRQVLLVDFAVAWPDDNLKITADGVRDIIVKCGLFEQQYIDFQTKLLYRTGLGNETYL
ncbi:fatty acid elongase, putative, partial [Entamoeba histolytica KU27]